MGVTYREEIILVLTPGEYLSALEIRHRVIAERQRLKSFGPITGIISLWSEEKAVDALGSYWSCWPAQFDLEILKDLGFLRYHRKNEKDIRITVYSLSDSGCYLRADLLNARGLSDNS